MNLPFDLGPLGAAFMVVAFFAAAFVRGYSGFGFGALVVSAGALVMNPLHLVAVAIIGDLILSLQQWHGVRHQIDWRRVLTLFAGSVIGLPLGLWALTTITEDLARAVIALYVLGMCLALLLGWTLTARAGTPMTFGTGAVSGVANAAGVGGLPVVVFFAAQTMAPVVFRATLIAYFMLLDLWTIPLLLHRGLISGDTLVVLVVALPLFVLGAWTGGRRFLRTEPREFRRFAIILLMALALSGLVKALWP
ncbi:MAG: putative permease [Rhodobacteraceae bacterium HLUCCA12]|nr:MAG: putative permease [Rhodobacteraceae bacterium HLUCCA12]